MLLHKKKYLIWQVVTNIIGKSKKGKGKQNEEVEDLQFKGGAVSPRRKLSNWRNRKHPMDTGGKSFQGIGHNKCKSPEEEHMPNTLKWK